MKRQNCVQVKNVNKLSIPYLTRFFGSVGPIIKIEKDDISKYVTIEFANKSCVDRVFRYEGRILDDRPIKIKKLRDSEPPEHPLPLLPPPSQTNQNTHQSAVDLFPSNGSQQELFLRIRDELMPHHIEHQQRLIISILIWRLADELSTDIKHLISHKVNMRSSYLKLQLEKQIIERISRKGKNAVTVSDNLKPVVIQSNNSEAMIWFAVPYPNTEECKQSKVQAASQMTKCISTIRNQLSIRIADNLTSLYTASLCFNSEENEVENIINLKTHLATSQEDNFCGLIQNIGARNIFYDFLQYEQPNSCVQLKQSKIICSFQCTMRLYCPPLSDLKGYSWCHFYRGQLCRRINGQKQIYYIKNKYKTEYVRMASETLAFEASHFSLLRMGKQINNYREIFEENSNFSIVYITKGRPDIVADFKVIDEVPPQKDSEELSTIQKQRSRFEDEVGANEELVSRITIIEIKYQGAAEFVRQKLSQYLLSYIKDHVLAKGLIIASKEMAYKLAANIIQREKQNRLFDFAQIKYQKYIGDELWRLYEAKGQIKAKEILAKYSAPKK